MHRREFYKISSANLYNGEGISFLKVNSDLHGKLNYVSKGVLIGKNLIPKSKMVDDKKGISRNIKYYNDLVPEYMILEKIDNKYYELLSGLEVTTIKDYYKGIGVYAIERYYNIMTDDYIDIIDINDLVEKISAQEVANCYQSYDLNVVEELYKSFAAMANSIMEHKKQILIEKLNELEIEENELNNKIR